MSQSKRYLLVGGGGFIGRQVAAHLIGQGEVHAIARSGKTRHLPGIAWHEGDFHDVKLTAQLISDLSPTHFVHLGWTTTHGDFWTSPENTAWLNSSLAAARAFGKAGGKRIVMTGTCAEYDTAALSPLHETRSPIRPAQLYGEMKDAARREIQALSVEYGFSFAWARVFHVYGPFENVNRLVPGIILSLLAGNPARCTSGIQRRDFMDVRDMGAALAKLADHHVTGPVNLGTGRVTSVAELAQAIGALMGRPDLIHLGAVPDRPQEVGELYPDIGRMRDELGVTAAISLHQGMGEAIAWWNSRAL